MEVWRGSQKWRVIAGGFWWHLEGLTHFVVRGGAERNVVSGSPGGGQKEGDRGRQGSQTPVDPKGSADLERDRVSLGRL